MLRRPGTIARGYLDAALASLGAGYEPEDFESATLAQMVEDCWKFEHQNVSDIGGEKRLAGSGFWQARNSTRRVFFANEAEFGVAAAARLDRAAKEFGGFGLRVVRGRIRGARA